MGSSNEYVFDTSRWPIVYGPPLEENPTPERVEAFYTSFKRLFQRGERFVYVHDVRGARSMSAQRRRRLTQFIDEERLRLERYLGGLAIVVDSRAVEAIVTALTWLVPPFLPIKMFRGDLAPAYEWAQARLDDAPHGRGLTPKLS